MASVFSSKEKGEGKEVAPGLGGLNPRGFAAGFQGEKPWNEGWLLIYLMAKGRIAHLQLQELRAQENNSSQS